MGVFKRADSRYWWMNYMVDGVQVSKSTKTRDRQRAEIVYKETTGRLDTRSQMASGEIPGVYAIRARVSGLVKIGFSANVCQRLRHLQQFSPDPLEIVALFPTTQASQLEAFIHRRLHLSRIHSEWFEISWLDLHDAATAFYRERARAEFHAEEFREHQPC